MGLAETAQLAVALTLKDQLTPGLSKASGAVGTFGTRIGGISGALGKMGGAMSHAAGQIGGLISSLGMVGGVGLIGGIAAATKSAMSFQAQMELIATQAGGTQAEVEHMTKAIMDMATSVATSPEALAAGLYHVESAGLRGAKALDVLRAAAEGAKVGGADLESVTNALIAATNSGVGGVKSMEQAMGALNAIVGAGNMRMQDLADAFSTGILSAAKTFGISLQSVGAAIADMTNQGVPAADAATRLRMTISLLGAPTSKAASELKKLGLNSTDLANAMRGPEGILGAVAMLKDRLDKSGMSATQQAQLISAAFGGGRSSSAIMTLLGSVGKFRDIQEQITKGAGAFGDAWTKTTQDAEFKWQKFQTSLSVLGIRFGNVVLPVITGAMDSISDWISTHGDQLTGMFQSAVVVAQQLGGAIKIAFGAISTAWGMIPGPLQQLLVGGFVVNKAAGWLFGTSPLSALMNMLRGGLKGGVGGLAAGALGVQHVWVDNMGMGGMGGPGLLGAAAGGSAAIGVGALGISVAGLAIAGYDIAQRLGKNNDLGKLGLTAAEIQAYKYSQMSEADRINAGKHGYGPGTNYQSDLAAALAKINAWHDAQPKVPVGSVGIGGLLGEHSASVPAARLLALAASGHGQMGDAAVLSSAQALLAKFSGSTAPSTRSLMSAIGSLTGLKVSDPAAQSKLDAIRSALSGQLHDIAAKLEAVRDSRPPEVTVNVTVNVNARQNANAASVQSRIGPTVNQPRPSSLGGAIR